MTTLFPLGHLAPLLVLAAAVSGFARPGRRPAQVPQLAEAAALGALALAAFGALQLVLGAAQTTGSGGFLLRLDAASATMTLLVAFVGWIVVRYSRSYLDGEAQEGRFHGLMLTALAAVLVLVQSGSLPVLIGSFIAIGVVLRQLLLFYDERAEACRAATKFTLVWGAGDVALVLAGLLLWQAFGTVNVVALGTAAQSGLPLAGHWLPPALCWPPR